MIEMQAPPAREWSSVARDIAGTVYVVSDLEPGQDYRFRVRARTPLGVMSEPSCLWQGELKRTNNHLQNIRHKTKDRVT
jgi:hypothetical protein